MKRGYLIGMFLGAAVVAANADAAETIPPLVTITPKGPVVSLASGDSVEQAPDIATINVSLTTRNRDRAAAVTASNAGLAKIRAALAAKGVATADIEQGYFSAREDFDGNGSARRSKGFVVDTSFQVKLRRLDALGDTIGAVVAAGASDVGNPEFDVENKAPILEKLTVGATAKARAKAMIHARLHGFSGVRLLSVMDNSNPNDGMAPINKFGFAEARAMRIAQEEVSPVADLTPRPVTISVSLAMAFEMTN